MTRRGSGTIQAYLDYNASAPVRPEVIEAVAAALGRTGNPSSVHQAGREARALLEHARAAVAALVGAPPNAVVFTSGGTEANNQALQSVTGLKLISAIEHDSVLAAAPDALRIPVYRDGVIELQTLEEQLKTLRPALVSVMLANNETGLLQPVRELVACARRHGALVHCDAVQAAGKIPLDVTDLGADFVTLSAHKLGGPAEATLGATVTNGGTKFLADLVGVGRARYILFTGELLDAGTATEWGLVEVLAQDGELESIVSDLVGKIAANYPQALQLIKNAVRIGIEDQHPPRLMA